MTKESEKIPVIQPLACWSKLLFGLWQCRHWGQLPSPQGHPYIPGNGCNSKCAPTRDEVHDEAIEITARGLSGFSQLLPSRNLTSANRYKQSAKLPPCHSLYRWIPASRTQKDTLVSGCGEERRIAVVTGPGISFSCGTPVRQSLWLHIDMPSC